MNKSTAKPTSIDEYINSCPKEVQGVLQTVKQTIKQVAPDAEETISYQMPAFKLQGKNLVYFAAWEKHIALYPTPAPIEELSEELAPYKTGKGTLQFPLDKPLPLALIQKIVRVRMKEVLDKKK